MSFFPLKLSGLALALCFHSEEATLTSGPRLAISNPWARDLHKSVKNLEHQATPRRLPMEPEITHFQQLRICQTSASLALICQTSHFWSETELLIEVLVRVSQLTMNRLWIELTGVIEVAFDTSSSMTILNIGSNRGWPCDGFHTCENT